MSKYPKSMYIFYANRFNKKLHLLVFADSLDDAISFIEQKYDKSIKELGITGGQYEDMQTAMVVVQPLDKHECTLSFVGWRRGNPKRKSKIKRHSTPMFTPSGEDNEDWFSCEECCRETHVSEETKGYPGLCPRCAAIASGDLEDIEDM